jgi:hypothetical protein
VIGCPATDLYTNNHPVWKTQLRFNFLIERRI